MNALRNGVCGFSPNPPSADCTAETHSDSRSPLSSTDKCLLISPAQSPATLPNAPVCFPPLFPSPAAPHPPPGGWGVGCSLTCVQARLRKENPIRLRPSSQPMPRSAKASNPRACQPQVCHLYPVTCNLYPVTCNLGNLWS